MTVAQRPDVTESHDEDPASDGDPVSVLVLGPLAQKGGISQYIDKQGRRLPDSVEASFYDTGAPSSAPGGLLWLLRTTLLALWAAVRFPFRRPPDVVHVHTSHRFSFYRSAGYVLVASWVWRRPVVLHVHGSSFDEFVTDASLPVTTLQRVVFRAADRVVVLSDYWRDVLAEHVDPAKLVVLPNAVDPGRYDPNFDADPARLVYVSALVDRKGIRELVTAVEAALERVDRPFEVDVAGSGTHRELVADVASRVPAVSYHGYVSEQRKRELLSEGSIYVLPTRAENLPIAMLEGMAGGNAVVSTPVGGIPNVVGDDNGVLVPPGDADALADAIVELLSDPDRIERLARNNRTVVEREHSWEAAVADLESLYRRLAAN
jgi:glycosyltransferase involved in cell wall biosynthesis